MAEARKNKAILRRVSSALLSVLMTFSCAGLFSYLLSKDLTAAAVGLTSQAQGNYTFSVYFKRDGGSLDDKTAKWGTSQNDNCCIAIRYRGDNGYASSTSTTADYWNGTRGYDWHYNGTVAGFPDGVFGHINENNVARNAKLFIHGFKVNGVQVWSGMKDMISSTDDHYAYWYAKYYPSGSAMGTWSNNCNDGDTNDTNIWWQPHPTSTFTGDTSTVYTDGSVTRTYGVTAVKDQYSVNWGFNSIQWTSSNSNATITNAGVATFGNNGGTDYDVTFTPKYVSNSATVTSDNGITVHVVTAKKLDVNGYLYTVAKDSGANDGGLGNKAKATVYVDNSVHSSGNNVNDFYSDVKYNRSYKIEVTPVAGWKMAG
ncbi:MAG: hypothetical protein K6C36_03760, partial [Clostridia bacterium]|nr:hypothetical protein [Clostridia bacterium]